MYRVNVECMQYISVNVLCADSDDTEDDVAYKKCFERFIRQDLSYTIKWISKKSELNAKERFLFLLDVKTRIPEDFQRALERLDLTGKTLIYKKRTLDEQIKCICFFLLFLRNV